MVESLKEKIREKAKTLTEWWHSDEVTLAELVRLDDVVAVLDDVTKQIREEFDNEIKIVRAVCHNYLKQVLSEEKLQDVVIFHLNNLRKRLAVLDGEANHE